MMTAQRVLSVTVSALATCCASCVQLYEVRVVNRLDVPVVIEIAQYHSRDFGGTPPNDFTPDLLIQTQLVSVEARQRIEVSFTSAAGGFWLRWKQLQPATNESAILTLDLIRDKRKIVIGP